MIVHPPKWKWEWGPNTIVILAGFASGFVAWGYTLSDLMTAKAFSETAITEIRADIRRLDEGNRRYDNLEYRVGITETMARDAAITNVKTTEAIAQLASDMRVTREILQRLEATGRGP